MAVSSGEMNKTTKAVALALTLGLGGGALAGAGCGSGGEQAKLPAPKTAQPFEIKNHESLLADRIPLSPAKMTVDACYKHFWSDRPGKREPSISAPEAPLTIIVDGRCNVPLSSHNVGLYAEPTEETGNIAAELTNGQVVGVVCQTEGQVIEDVRGGLDASDKWVKAVDREGDVGYIPTVNAGFPNLVGIPEC